MHSVLISIALCLGRMPIQCAVWLKLIIIDYGSLLNLTSLAFAVC